MTHQKKKKTMKTLNEIEEMMRTYRDDLNSPDRTTRIIAQEVIKTLEWVIDYKNLDPIVQEVCDNLQRRSRLGQAKYNTTLFANRATYDEWLNHLQEELMDATLYIQKLKSEEE